MDTNDPNLPPVPGVVEAPTITLRPMAPVNAGERLELIDLLRGIAIFGILLVNMQVFFTPMYLPMVAPHWWQGAANRVAEIGIMLLAQGKFYAMFSFLFGLGLAIQMDRAATRGKTIGGFFARRMSWLLLIGLVHAFLIWFGDILVLYSLLGFVLILFRKLSIRALVIWAIGLFLVPIVFMGSFAVLMELLRLSPEQWDTLVQPALDENRQMMIGLFERAMVAYAEGSYREILSMRWTQLGLMYQFVFVVAPQILGLFLLGLAAGRARLFHEIDRHLPALRRWCPRLGLLGLAAATLGVVAAKSMDPLVPSWWTVAQSVGMILGGPLLCFFYIGAVVLLTRDPVWMARLRPITYVGRMALTNYLMHSIVFTTVANSYGFGLYGRISPAVGLALTTVMFLIQIPLSRFWLERFRFGPMEWLWRSLTYMKRQPMRREVNP